MSFPSTSPPSPSLAPSPPSAPTTPHHARVRSAPALTLDLASIATSLRAQKHAHASNTLLLTGLEDLRLFAPPTLAAIKAFLHGLAPLNSFSPLPSLRRIVVSFRDPADAVRARTYLELKGLRTSARASPAPSPPQQQPASHAHAPPRSRRPMLVTESDAVFPRIYFGETTPLVDTDHPTKKHFLDLPPAGKLFFISPPPSPPAGWQLRPEDPPNKEVHASDLAVALRQLGGAPHPDVAAAAEGARAGEGDDDYELTYTPASISPTSPTSERGAGGGKRTRSLSATVIYDPEDHGTAASHLPAVTVEDTTARARAPEVEVEGGTATTPVVKAPGVPVLRNVKTSRPPVD